MDRETKEMVPVHPPLRDELRECLDGLDVGSGEVDVMVLPPLQSSLICPTFNQADKLIVQLVLPRKYRTFSNSCFYISLCS